MIIEKQHMSVNLINEKALGYEGQPNKSKAIRFIANVQTIENKKD